MEALCRMATPNQRRELADQWFSMGHVANAFAKIRDSEFEMACRKFLNMVNGMQGDRRRVYSYPCLEVYLGKYELLMPSDENLEEFWIDFNLGSHSISFYFSLTDEETQEGHWETICINENEVQSYTVTGEGHEAGTGEAVVRCGDFHPAAGARHRPTPSAGGSSRNGTSGTVVQKRGLSSVSMSSTCI
ncbi:synaptonemal complex protein 2-like [Amphiprion ocellaris]|uniref:Synaptonemal complex protein 2 Spt16M-like domain-containing protein n=1 Tax=Amphiprion ocellaris TaxID=80972 RepID=A0AAQ5YWN5_AMPOC|nr:synaptonemal complex protein 2-like [Amphiprion ocellaris]XP_054862016.1 synaptonemal complex protein 2-like [Amphiprion ocellaris]